MFALLSNRIAFVFFIQSLDKNAFICVKCGCLLKEMPKERIIERVVKTEINKERNNTRVIDKTNIVLPIVEENATAGTYITIRIQATDLAGNISYVDIENVGIKSVVWEKEQILLFLVIIILMLLGSFILIKL